VGAVCGRGRGTKIKTKANRCGACNYSIVLNAHRVTSMTDTDIDAIKKRKNAERIKQYRLKRKLLMQRQASTSTETKLDKKQKKAEYNKQKFKPSIFKDESTGSCI
jgi:hypothetical protein